MSRSLTRRCSIIAIRGFGWQPHKSGNTISPGDQKVSDLLAHLHKKINARTISFRPAIYDDMNPYSAEGVIEIAGLLLSELRLLRDEERGVSPHPRNTQLLAL